MLSRLPCRFGLHFPLRRRWLNRNMAALQCVACGEVVRLVHRPSLAG